MPGSIVDGERSASEGGGARWRFRPGLWPTLATVVLFPALLTLGLWQLERAELKQEAIARAGAEDERPPARLGPEVPDKEGGAGVWNHRRVDATGHYLSRQFLLDNRTRRGVAGYHVLTPLILDGERRQGVIVNRGWIALGPSREHLPETTVPGGTLELRGRGRVPGAAFLLGEAGYAGDEWPRVVQSIDLPKMEEALGVDLLPFVLELDRSEPHGFAREWRPHRGIGPARHRAYAFQWFALAATLLAIYTLVNLRRR